MAEVHIIGQITDCKEFPKQELFCKWYIQIGKCLICFSFYYKAGILSMNS